jgi:hypothetical protein
MHTIAAIWHQLQASLFPGLEQTLGRPLTDRQGVPDTVDWPCQTAVAVTEEQPLWLIGN